MGRPNELGQVKAGYLADLLLVDGDPVADITVLQDHSKLLGIMKDGRFHKDPGTGTEARPADIAIDDLVKRWSAPRPVGRSATQGWAKCSLKVERAVATV